METLLISAADLAQIVRHVGVDRLMHQLIERLMQSLLHYDPRSIEVRKRDGFAYQTPHPGVLEWMPVMRRGESSVIKVVGYNPHNPTLHGAPTIVSTISLYDIATGHLRLLMDGVFPTAMRTGAASAVASRLLARQDAEVLGIVGCGAQAVTQLHALSLVFPLRRVLAFDIDPAVSATYARRCGFVPLPIELVPLQVLEAEADILCTATSVPVGGGPVIRGEQLKEWIHINAVGSDLPGKTELPLSLLERSLVCPDYLEQALVEGECQQLKHRPSRIGPSLVELVQGPKRDESIRHSPTVFDSTGFALEDQVALELFLEYAQELRLGRRVELEGGTTDVRNPYALPGLLPTTDAERQQPGALAESPGMGRGDTARSRAV
nr:lysine cyclodeaminase [Cystobacter sp.]